MTHSRDHRRLDVEDLHEDFSALTKDFVVALRREEIETFGTDRLYEGVAASGQDDDAVVGVRADRVKEVDELFVGVPVEHQRSRAKPQRLARAKRGGRQP